MGRMIKLSHSYEWSRRAGAWASEVPEPSTQGKAGAWLIPDPAVKLRGRVGFGAQPRQRNTQAGYDRRSNAATWTPRLET